MTSRHYFVVWAVVERSWHVRNGSVLRAALSIRLSIASTARCGVEDRLCSRFGWGVAQFGL